MNKNEQNINEKIGKFRKIKSGKKGNYINEDKTEKQHKRKHYNTELEKIYSEDIDKRYKNLIMKGYDYIINLLKYEFDNKSNIIFLEEKVGQAIYFILLNYIIIFELGNKNKLIDQLQKKQINRNNIYKILEILNIEIKNVKVDNILNTFLGIDIKDINQQELKKLIIEELEYIKLHIEYNSILLNLIKERKNKIAQEISTLVLNTYDFLFLIYYIITFFDELSFIISENGIKEIKENFQKYDIIIKEEEFVTIIEVIVMFFLKGYKSYLYKNYNFLGAINDLVLKTKKALEYKKWSPIKSNFKSWLSNWSKNYIKQYIQEEVRPLEEMERMNYIYNQLSDIISNNPNINNNNLQNKNIKLNDDEIIKGTSDDIEVNTLIDKDLIEKEIDKEIQKEINEFKKKQKRKADTKMDGQQDNSIDIKTVETYKRQILNSNNNDFKENYDKVLEYMGKLEKIFSIKKQIERKDIKIKNQNIKSEYKKKLIKYIKETLFDIHDYISDKTHYDLTNDEKGIILIDKILDNIEKLDINSLYIFTIKMIEIIIGKEIESNINILKIIDNNYS